MELAIVTVAQTGDGSDFAELQRVVPRLARQRWDGLFAEQHWAPTARRVAHALGAAVSVGTRLDFADLITVHPGQRLVVLSEPAPIRKLIADVLEVDSATVPMPQPLSLSRVRASRSGKRSLIGFNDTTHLAVVGLEPAAPTTPRRRSTEHAGPCSDQWHRVCGEQVGYRQHLGPNKEVSE